jgi:hypothetical protein
MFIIYIIIHCGLFVEFVIQTDVHTDICNVRSADVHTDICNVRNTDIHTDISNVRNTDVHTDICKTKCPRCLMARA